MPFVQMITILYDNALRGGHLYSRIYIVIMPFVQAITVLYDNALRGDHLYSRIYIVIMPFVLAITVGNYSIITIYVIVTIPKMQTNNEYFLLLVTTKNCCYIF